MTKIISTALLLAAGTALSNAATYTVSVSSGTSANGNYYGFCVALGESYMTPSSTLPKTGLELDSVTLYVRTSGTVYSTGESIKLAVYSDGSNGSRGNFVALSNSATVPSSADGSAFTFTFADGVSINTTSTYQVLFVKDTVKDSSAIADGSAYEENAKSVGLNILQQSTLPAGSGTLKNTNLGAGNDDWEGYYLPKVDIAVSTVPEPSAFGLLAGLGALALVASRRRRTKRA